MTAPTPKQLHQFILERFSEVDLDLFCLEYFRDAAHSFGSGMSQSKKALELLGYCDRRALMDSLLVALEKEREQPFRETFATQLRPTIAPPPEKSPRAPAPKASSFMHEKTGLEFVRIPAGEFLYGDEKKPRQLPEYWISKTPVTQAVYQRFITTNPKQDVPFVRTIWAKPYNWHTKKRTYPADKADHPVALVRWVDAVAFCEWAGLQLPTEEQWEKAARGTDGRKYPWGDNEPTDKLCNFNRNMGGTTPVGQYSPQGDSPYGCVDMSGNVWEWCLNKYDKPEDTSIDQSNERRVLRGGSWSYFADLVRATFRYLHPASRFSSFGFRVVVVRPPSQ